MYLSIGWLMVSWWPHLNITRRQENCSCARRYGSTALKSQRITLTRRARICELLTLLTGRGRLSLPTVLKGVREAPNR